jgi:hypothetical protein
MSSPQSLHNTTIDSLRQFGSPCRSAPRLVWGRKMGVASKLQSHRPPERALPVRLGWFARLCSFAGFRRGTACWRASGKIFIGWDSQYIRFNE